jgi:hypothetical protein
MSAVAALLIVVLPNVRFAVVISTGRRNTLS